MTVKRSMNTNMKLSFLCDKIYVWYFLIFLYMYWEVIIATNVKKKATIQKAAKKLNFPLTKLIIAMQHFSFRQPNFSL